jgi:hypothetical protein
MQVAVLKLVDTTRTFYYLCPELHSETAPWQSFKAIFRERFKAWIIVKMSNSMLIRVNTTTSAAIH